MTDDTNDAGPADDDDRAVTNQDATPDSDVEDDESADTEDEMALSEPGDDDSVSDDHAVRRWVLPIATGVLAVLAVALAAGLFVVQGDRSDLEDDANRRADIVGAASEFALAVLTYDHTDLEPSAAAIEALATESFAAEYREGFEANLRSVIVEAGATSTARVDDVFVNDTTGDTARVIAIATAEVRSEAQSRVEVTSFIDLQMVRIDGRWLVDNMVSLGSDGAIVDEEGNPISPESPEQDEDNPVDTSESSTTSVTTGG